MTALTREQVEAMLARTDAGKPVHAFEVSVALRALLAAWDREAKLREALRELIAVSSRAIGISKQHAGFKLYAMDPMHEAITDAAKALGETP